MLQADFSAPDAVISEIDVWRTTDSLKRTQSMQLGMVGLGRMGANMVKRLVAHGHECTVFDRSPEVVEELAKEKGVTGSSSLQDMVARMAKAAIASRR